MKVPYSKRRKRRIVIALSLAFCSLLGIYVIRALDALTAGVQINRRELVVNILATIFIVMAVELLLEGFSLRNEDLNEIESATRKLLDKITSLDREFLLKDIVALVANEWEKDEPLVEARKLYGLERIYPSRQELREEILDKVRNAKTEIWLLAITFSGGVSLDDRLLRELRNKLNQNVKVRILGANAIRSLAVFRTLLETSNQDVKKMVKSGGYTHYFDHRFYLKFREFLRNVHQYFHDHQEIVRFYPHSPGCWMVRIDDDFLYYQPYVLGRIEDALVGNRPDDEEEARTIGDLMPVFKFVDATKKPFQSLKKHFEKLWSTSDVDIFHMGARVENRDFRLQRIFVERGPWFQHVMEALAVKVDRRKYPRKLYLKDPSQKVRTNEGSEDSTEEWMYWTFEFSDGPLKQLCPIRVKMEDVSYDGCAIRLDADARLRDLFRQFSQKALEIQKNPRFRTDDLDVQSFRAECVPEMKEGFATLKPPSEIRGLKELEYLVGKMLERCNFEFKVQSWNWDEGNEENDLIIGMQYRKQPRRHSPLPCVSN